MRPSLFLLVLLLTVFSFLSFPVQAYEEPALNLGFTSFLDGGPPAGPGWYFTQYMQYWHNNQLTDHHGRGLKLPVFGPAGGPPTGFEDDNELDAWIGLTQLIYQSDQEVFCGAKWGLDFIVPEVKLDLDTGASDLLLANDSALGDIWIGPYLQWDPIMGPQGPKFMHRIELQFILPTGDYDNDYELNAGSNFFSFDPYWAGTYFFTPRLSASCRLHYLWNAENQDPSQRLYPGAGTVQAGQAFHMNFAADYELCPKTLHVGVNGYYLEQLTESKFNGHSIPDSEERVFAIGPGFVYHFNKDNHLFCNVYFESSAENRPEGNKISLRYVKHF
jgi:hypothetical protein